MRNSEIDYKLPRTIGLLFPDSHKMTITRRFLIFDVAFEFPWSSREAHIARRRHTCKDGCQASNGFLSDGGTGCSIIHFFPFTAPGRNNNPSSAMNVINASRVFFSSAIFENACSVFTISCSADCPCTTAAIPKKQQHHNLHTHNPSPNPSNPRSRWPLATHFPASTHRCCELWKAAHDSSPPIDHTSQTTQADTNSPSTLLYSPRHKQR